ncbi:MAG: hypothetical protein H6701_05555 [Myxococcales bacterium]|nr:hypothetical protein [Myxococcales bacterium]
MDADALRARLADNPDDWVAAEQLTRLLIEAEQWEALIELLFARMEAPDADRADLLSQLADVFEAHLGDAERALVVLLEAFALSRDDEQLGVRLGRLAARAGQWDALIDAYERALGEATAREAVALHRRLSQWYEALEREDDVARHLRRLLVLKPDDERALEALTGFYEAAEDWEGLTQLLRTRVNYVTDPEARRRLYLRVGRLLETRLDAPGEALEWLGRLFHEAPEAGVEATLERLAELSGDYATLARIYREALAALDPDSPRVPRLHLRIGRIHRDGLADEAGALRHFRAAYEAAPDDRVAFGELRALLGKREQWVELARLLGDEAHRVDDRSERYKLFFEQGEIYQDKLDATREAVDAWFGALEARPDDKIVLVRLMDAYTHTGQWEASIKVLRKLASVEPDPAKKAQYVYAMGIIQRDKLEDHYISVRTLDRALELDPTMVKAFQAIDEILTTDGDYPRQDRYYRKMLARAREHRLDEALIVNLARNLGEINRSRLANYEEALKAFSIVVKLRPDDRAARSIVAELLVMLGRYEDATRHYFRLIQQDVVHPEPYHELVRIYCAEGRLDPAWCCAAALVALGRQNDDEDQLFDMGLARQQALAVGTMEAVDWKLLTWADKNHALDALFRRLLMFVGPRMARNPKDLGLKRTAERAHPVMRIVAEHVAPVMAMPVPVAWLSDEPVGLGTANVNPPALVIGSDAAERAPGEIAFLAARELFLLTGDHFFATLDGDVAQREARLAVLVATVHRWIDPRVPEAAIDPSVAEILTALSDEEKANFRQLLGPVVSEPAYGIPRWLDAIEHTANRLGLLICNDLETALRQLKRVGQPLGRANAAERTRALLLFALSEPYFELRRRLGYAIAG